MPIYEFRCANCGQIFEKLLPLGSRQAPSCPRCADGQVQRLVSIVARATADCGPSGST